MQQNQIRKNKGKITFGTASCLKLNKKVYLASNAPEFIKAKFKQYQMLQFDNQTLGKTLARNHNVSVICINA